MSQYGLTKEDMANKIVSLRDLRFDIEKLKIKAKKAGLDEDDQFQQHLQAVETHYDLYKEKLTEFSIREDESDQECSEILDKIWRDLELSVQNVADYVS
jgi:septal ring factor EnvC (AmiA/AmiB activator)